MIVGYARTSTLDQRAGLEAQIQELKAAGCTKIFSEHASSIGRRPQLEACLEFVREEDIFVVTKLDRFVRSVSHFLKLSDELKERGVELRVLGMDLDTRTPTGKLILTVMSGVAQFEREMMLERQREGIDRAKAAGRFKGRKPTARAKSPQILELADQGLSMTKIAAALGISRPSVSRVLAARERAARAAAE